MNDDPTSGDALHAGLYREVLAMLTQDGIRLPDYEIKIPPERVSDLDASDIVIVHDDEDDSTIVDVHRPLMDSNDWRHEAFVLKDDGTTAWVDMTIQLTPEEVALLRDPERLRLVVARNIMKMSKSGAIDISEATELYNGIADECLQMLEEIQAVMMLNDELNTSTREEQIDEIVNRYEATTNRNIANRSDYIRLARVVKKWYKSHGLAVLQRDYILTISQQQFRRTVSDAPEISPKKMWELLELLDRVREI